MSKIVEASVTVGILRAEGVPVLTATKLSKGVGASEGVMLMDKDKQWYIPNTQPDLETTLTNISAALAKTSEAIAKICDTMTAINAAHAGPATAPSPAVAPNVLQITAMKLEIDAAKAQLDALKGALI